MGVFMKIPTIIIVSTSFAIFLLGFGCEKGEEQDSMPITQGKKSTVRQSIKESAPKIQEKTQEKEPLSKELIFKPSESSESGEKETADTKSRNMADPDKAAASAEKQEKKTPERPLMEKGRKYIVQKGDTLVSIAAKKDIYGDPLKWVVLYRSNIDRFSANSGDILPDEVLSEGSSLKLVNSLEMEENLKNRSNTRWVLNVFSSQKEENVVPLVIKLIKQGYLVYLTRAEVKGTEWIRIRVGFYPDRKTAMSKVNKMEALLEVFDIWAVQIGDQEFAQYISY
jgi:LysM repeat protein